MIDNLLELVNSNLNIFPDKNGISKTLSPAAIVMGTPKLEYSHLKLEFGVYVRHTLVRLTQPKPRWVTAIVLIPSSRRR